MEALDRHLLKTLPGDGSLAGRLDRSLAGFSNAVEATLPRHLRREGVARLSIRRLGNKYLGEWVGASGEIELAELAELQFRRLGELPIDASQRLAGEFLQLVRSSDVELPSFSMERTDDSGGFVLFWQRRPGSAAPRGALSGEKEQTLPPEPNPLDVPELAEVAEAVHSNYAATRREPSAVRVQPFVPEQDAAALVPAVVSALTERVSCTVKEGSDELASLVDEQIITYEAKATREGSGEAQRAVAWLLSSRAVLRQIAASGSPNRTMSPSSQENL